jgi:hypothetical protein
MCNLAFFIFDEAKCLAAISTFGEEIDLTLGSHSHFSLLEPCCAINCRLRGFTVNTAVGSA